MAHSENYLKKVIFVQDIVIEHKNRGTSAKWVYDNVIKDMPPFISYETFRKYMCINAKAKLTALRNNLNHE